MIDTINRVGFENLTGTAFYESLTSGQVYSGLQGVLDLEFSDTRRTPNQTRIGQLQYVDNGNGAVTPVVVPLTDWVEMPDLSAP